MLNYAKAIGANTDVVTAQAFIFPKEEDSDQILVVLISGIGEEAFATIRKVGLEAQEVFFAQQNIAQSFEELMAFIKAEVGRLEQFSAVVGLVEKQTLYLETLNQFKVLLFRHGHATSLTHNLESQKMISGMLQKGDRVLFLSLPLTEAENPDGQRSLETNLLSADLETLEDEVETLLQQQSKPDPVAAVLIEETIPEATDGVKEQKPVEEPIPDNSALFEAERNITISQVRLDGKRAKTPSFLLLILSFLQKIPLRPTSKKKLAVLIVIIGIGLFIIGNIFITNSKKTAQFNAKLTAAGQKLDQAVTVKDSDPVSSKTLLTEAKSDLKEAEVLKPNDSKAKAMEQKINEATFLVFKQFNQKDFPVFLDLNLIKDNISATRLSMSLGKMAVLDHNSKSLIVIDIAQKQPQILAGPLQLGDAQLMSLNGDYVYVFSKDKGILKVDAGNGKVSSAVPSDTDWQKIVDIYGFANNVYLLDEFKNQIWKYIATDTGFSPKNQYLQAGESADFAAARNLEIDGSIWILKSDNTILKFTQGAKDFFQIGQLDTSLDQIKSFYLADDTDNIYFLDNQNSRVVVTNKKGEYVAQYIGDKFKTATDLVVDEKGKKLYLLGEGKIYQVDLK